VGSLIGFLRHTEDGTSVDEVASVGSKLSIPIPEFKASRHDFLAKEQEAVLGIT
jgi:hypothetical protein